MNTIIATKENIGLLIDRFNKFLKRNVGKQFQVKQVWGKPAKRETWEGNPRNKRFLVTPRIKKHPSFGKSTKLLSLQLQSVEDVIQIHFTGDRKAYRKHYPKGIDLSKTSVHAWDLFEGDSVTFKHEGILVIPKENDSITKEKLSWMFTTITPSKQDFNKNHPERRSDEVFLTNSDNGLAVSAYKTLRVGTISYDQSGKPLGNRWQGSHPVFVKIAEIEKYDEELLPNLLPS